MEACMTGNEFIYGHCYTVFLSRLAVGRPGTGSSGYLLLEGRRKWCTQTEEIILAFIHGYTIFPICGYLWKAVLSETNLK